MKGADAGVEDARNALAGHDVPARDGARGVCSGHGKRSREYEVRRKKQSTTILFHELILAKAHFPRN